MVLRLVSPAVFQVTTRSNSIRITRRISMHIFIELCRDILFSKSHGFPLPPVLAVSFMVSRFVLSLVKCTSITTPHPTQDTCITALNTRGLSFIA